MTATRIGRIGSSGPAYELAEWPTAPTHHPPVAVAINAEPARVLSSFSSLDARIAAHLREGDDLVPSAPWWNRLTVPLATDAALSTARAVAPTSETDGPVAVVTGETTAVTGWLADGGPDPADGGAHGAAVAVATAAAFPELRPLRSLQFQPTAASLPRNRGSLDLRDDTRHPAIFLSTSTTDDAAVATEMPSPTTGDDEYDEVLVALRREVQACFATVIREALHTRTSALCCARLRRVTAAVVRAPDGGGEAQDEEDIAEEEADEEPLVSLALRKALAYLEGWWLKGEHGVDSCSFGRLPWTPSWFLANYL